MLEHKVLEVYHGSDMIVKAPDPLKSRKYKDFGMGFYVTLSEFQAGQLAVSRAKQSQLQRPAPIISKYIFDLPDFLTDGLKLFEFEDASEDWFDFIIKNRQSPRGITTDIDVIYGKVADQLTWNILRQYMAGLFRNQALSEGKSEKQIALELLDVNRLTDQLCFKTQKSLKYLQFKNSDIADINTLRYKRQRGLIT